MSFQEFEPIFHNLNEEFNNLKGKINILMNKFSDLEKQLKSNSKAKFRCSKCNKYFESMDNFQKHKEKNEICDANLYPYQCEKCELLFTSEKQLSTHKEKHGHFACGNCEKVFTFEGVLEKHVSAVHGSMKIYCHYYNNDKECPFKNECIFAHLTTKDCMFGNECERMYCMFKHDTLFQDNEDESEDENDESDCHETLDDDTVKMSEIEPIIAKVEQAMEKVNKLLQSTKLKCDSCDFVAKNQNGLSMHKKAKHPDKSN